MAALNTVKRQIDELAKTRIYNLRGSLQDASSCVLVLPRQRKGGEAVEFMPMSTRPNRYPTPIYWHRYNMGGKINFHRPCCNSFLDGSQCRAFSTSWHAKQLLPRKARPPSTNTTKDVNPSNEPIAAARQNQVVADFYSQGDDLESGFQIDFQTEERTRP